MALQLVAMLLSRRRSGQSAYILSPSLREQHAMKLVILLISALFVLSVSAGTWQSCASGILTINTLTVTPDPILIGQAVTINATGVMGSL
jgi:hypothetical protein